MAVYKTPIKLYFIFINYINKLTYIYYYSDIIYDSVGCNCRILKLIFHFVLHFSTQSITYMLMNVYIF